MKNKKLILQELKRREALHYPAFMRQMEYLSSWKDLDDYCEGEPTVIMGKGDGYAIHTKDEIVDVASSSPLEAMVLFLILRKHFSKHEKRISADFRNSTSYPILLAAASKGMVIIHKKRDWWWEGELMMEVEFSFTLRYPHQVG